MRAVFVFNGPNLKLLGTREPAIYGAQTLADIEELCRQTATGLGLATDCRQSNHEGELIAWIHEAGREVRAGRSIGAVPNAGAYTHLAGAARCHRGVGDPAGRGAHLQRARAGEGAPSLASLPSRPASSSATG